MDLYSRMQPWLGRKVVRGGLLVVVLVVVLGTIYTLGTTEQEAAEEALLPVVTLTTATQYAGNSSINLIGTVRAFSEAAVTAETAGRVTSVRVGLGDTVAAGQIIATLENASEQASVLQAEGVYDAALAAAAQSGVGTTEATTRLRNAENGAVATTKSAYATVEGILFNNIDQFFASPRGFIPGLRIDGAGFTQKLNNLRIDYQTSLPTWKSRVDAVTVNDNLDAELTHAASQVTTALDFVDTFIAVFNSQGATSRYTDAELQTFSSTFNGLRASLNQTQVQIDNAQSSLDSAREGLERANLAAAGGTTSAADAQIKQALGALRAAQANLAKTILRSPISGTVNTLAVRTGDFIGAQSKIAEVANNNALEVVTFAGENDRLVLEIGDAVVIEDQFAGTITEIAPAVDSATGKTEVRIASESDVLQNGDTVRITKEVAAATTTTKVIVPLSAVKFQINDGAVFVVVDNKLTARPVTLGTIRGGSVEILQGLTATEEFVADVRGLVEATEVEVIR